MNDWEAELWGEKDRPAPALPPATRTPTPQGSTAAQRYANGALDREVQNILDAKVPTNGNSGNRNTTFNNACFNMGQLVAIGAIDIGVVRERLGAAGRAKQMPQHEIDNMLVRSIDDGMKQPRQLPELVKAADDDLSWVNKATGEIADAAGPSKSDVEAFWSSRHELQVVRQMARARMTAPWTTLGCVLAHVVTAVPPFVVLPPLVGGYGSLNLFVGIVGPSGKGKGASGAAADAAVEVEYDRINLGTGEGIVAAYIKAERGGGFETLRTACLFNVPEIDTLTAIGGRQGATVLPVLRSAWSGEPLGFQNADAARRLHLPAHAYRLTLIAGIQPGRAEALLGDSDGGTPQRFMWMPAEDKDAAFPLPPEPKPYVWPGLGVLTADTFTGKVPMRLAPIIAETVRAERMASLRGEADDHLGGHDTFARVKAAAALAILAGRLDVTDEDWDLAGVMHAVSLSTRGAITDALQRQRRAKNQAAGVAEAERAEVVAEEREEKALRRVSRKVLTKVRGGGDFTASALRRSMTSGDRQYVDAALDRLVAAGSLAVDNSGSGAAKYRETGA